MHRNFAFTVLLPSKTVSPERSPAITPASYQLTKILCPGLRYSRKYGTVRHPLSEALYPTIDAPSREKFEPRVHLLHQLY